VFCNWQNLLCLCHPFSQIQLHASFLGAFLWTKWRRVGLSLFYYSSHSLARFSQGKKKAEVESQAKCCCICSLSPDTDEITHHLSPRKGSTLEGREVRTIIIDYAKKNDLVDANNKK
jgi:hypothetical protein